MKCLNCKEPISLSEKHCKNCGQKTAPPKLTVWSLITDFFNNLLNLDTKIYRTLIDLFKPGKLTTAYLAGQRSQYYKPIRILLVSMFAFLALIASVVNSQIPDLNEVFNSETRVRTIEEDVFERLDSIAPLHLDQLALVGLDSIKSNYYNKRITARDSFFLYDNRVMGLDFKKERILISDVHKLPIDQLTEKYKIHKWWNKLMIAQIIKIYKNPTGVPAFLIGNTLWAIVLVLLMIALFMKILYFRGGYLYVEHLVFLIHTHSFTFVFLSIAILIAMIFGLEVIGLNMGDENKSLISSEYINVVFLFPVIFFIMAMYRYYKRGIIYTLFSFFIIAMGYIIVLFLVWFFVALLSLAFF